MKRALFLGRFQPYHLGHHSVVERMATQADEVIIAVGSAQCSHSLKNPFTAGERILMIARALEGADIPRYVLPIQDIHRNALYARHIVSLTPPFEAVYSNNPLIQELFRAEGVEVHSPPLLDRDRYQGSSIRTQMLEGERWRPLVPRAVADVIDEIDGVRRYRRILEVTEVKA